MAEVLLGATALEFTTAGVAGATASGVTATTTAGLFGAGGTFGLAQAMSTLSYAGLGMQALGTVAQAGQSASSAEAAADYYEQYRLRTAQLGEYNAKLIEEQNVADLKNLRTVASREQAARRVAIASSGIETSGSALEILSGAAAEREMEIISTNRNAQAQAAAARYSAASDAASYGYRAQTAGLTGSSALPLGYLSAGSSLLTGGARTFYNYRQLAG